MASSVDAKLLKTTKFPIEFNQKVDMQKVNVEVMKKCVLILENGGNEADNVRRRWIAGKISEILGNEDDVVIELCFNLIEGARYVCLFQHYDCAKLICDSRISRRCRSSLLGFSIKTQLDFARIYGSFV
jgi:hypothetical protein